MKIQHQDKVKGTGSGKIIKSGYTLPFLPFPSLSFPPSLPLPQSGHLKTS